MSVNQRCKGIHYNVANEPLNHYNVVTRFSESLQRRLSMVTNMKRFSISLTPDLEADLDALKKDKFYNRTQSDIIRFLITLGLETFKREENDLSRIANQNDELNSDI